jgi:lipid kinase YegS
MPSTHIRLLLNGKKAANVDIRQSVIALREKGHTVDVRVSWESDDMLRFMTEAIADNVGRVVIGGGDGSLNEAVNALMQLSQQDHMLEIAVLPLGTANDFATACGISNNIHSTLELAIHGDSYPIDIIRANNNYFINAAVAGFGAQVTAETPTELKDFLGGGAYTLIGLAKALGFKPYQGSITTDKGTFDGDILVGAICNNKQAGGGQMLAPNALIDDGLMDITLLKSFSTFDIPVVLEEIQAMSHEARFCYHFQTRWLEIDFPIKLPLNLDGEPYPTEQMRFEVLPKAIQFVLPPDCPCLEKSTQKSGK